VVVPGNGAYGFLVIAVWWYRDLHSCSFCRVIRLGLWFPGRPPEILRPFLLAA
jgi:hypothetical protein